MTENGTGAKREIIKTSWMGKRQCQLGDENAPVFTIDVVQTMNRWREINQQFVDEKGQIPEERRSLQYAAIFAFVRDTAANLAYEGQSAKVKEYSASLDKTMSVADALHFLKLIDDEATALIPFFVPKSASTPSSADTTEVIYSQ